MKHFISLSFLLAFTFSTALWAQNSLELKVNFIQSIPEESGFTSAKYKAGEFPEAPFISLSAYVMAHELNTNLAYRLQTGGKWTSWQYMLPNTEGETPDRTTFYAPYLDQTFEAIQFRADQALNHEVVFRLFFPSASPETRGKMKAANDSICNCQKPSFCGRNCWCPDGDCPKDSNPAYTTPTHIIIHHSAGSSVSNNWPAVVTAIWDFHVNTNGWSDVGYNWLIDPNGVIYEGRGDRVLGAHFSCMNSGTTGICMLGNFETAQPTFSMISSLSYLIAWEACMENIPPQDSRWHASSQLNLPSVSSHRDGNTSTATNGCPKGTLCPGANLYAMLPSIRQAVASNPCTGTLGFAEAWKKDLYIYPNPAINTIEVHQESGLIGMVKELEIRNTAGQKVPFTQTSLQANGIEIDVNHLPSGIYFLRVITEKGTVTRSFRKN